MEMYITVSSCTIEEYIRSDPIGSENSYDQNGQVSEIQAIEEWLSPCDFGKIQNECISSCFKSVGQWLLEDEIFKSWAVGGRPWYLRCHGQQGTGKVGVHYAN